MMVTAGHSNNGRNQLTCIEKDKQKNNNKIRQHGKNKPIFQFLLFLFLVQPLFCSNNHHCDCHHRPLQQLPAMHAASRHQHTATAFSNALLLPLKLHFCQAAASAAKLAAAAVLPPPPPLLTRCQRRVTTAYKI
jgi:hypothetical protein